MKYFVQHKCSLFNSLCQVLYPVDSCNFSLRLLHPVERNGIQY